MTSHPPSRPAAGGLLLPVAAAPVRAGFPSPADDYLDDAISLDGYLISDPAATFLVRVRGDSMRGAGIDEGDLLVVDKGLTANHGDIIIAVVDGEFTVKRLHNTWRSMYPRQIVDGIQRDLMLTCYKGLTDKGVSRR